jgi:hypothetical protein
MYKVSENNFFLPDMCITQLAMLLYLEGDKKVPDHLKSNPSTQSLLNDLTNKGYLRTLSMSQYPSEKLWILTYNGTYRTEIYKWYTQVIPDHSRETRSPEMILQEIKIVLSQKKLKYNYLYRKYLYSYEACLVYQLNQTCTVL